MIYLIHWGQQIINNMNEKLKSNLIQINSLQGKLSESFSSVSVTLRERCDASTSSFTACSVLEIHFKIQQVTRDLPCNDNWLLNLEKLPQMQKKWKILTKFWSQTIGKRAVDFWSLHKTSGFDVCVGQYFVYVQSSDSFSSFYFPSTS